MKIEVGKKYKTLEGDIINMSKGNIDYWEMWGEGLTLYTEEEINLKTHTGKVNSDKLYEFSNDENFDYIVRGQLLYIAKEDKKYLTVDDVDWTHYYKYCRPYEPKEKHKKSIEILTHFNCKCGQWWSIGDFDKSIVELYCPKCGEKREITKETK